MHAADELLMRYLLLFGNRNVAQQKRLEKMRCVWKSSTRDWYVLGNLIKSYLCASEGSKWEWCEYENRVPIEWNLYNMYSHGKNNRMLFYNTNYICIVLRFLLLYLSAFKSFSTRILTVLTNWLCLLTNNNNVNISGKWKKTYPVSILCMRQSDFQDLLQNVQA